MRFLKIIENVICENGVYLTTFCFLAFVIYVRVRLLQIPLERDEGEYAYMGQLLLKGIFPYLHAYTMKLPGTCVAYAFFMKLFGQTVYGIHLGFLIVALFNIVLVGYLSQSLYENEFAVMASTISYSLLSVGQSVLGIFAHATHFVVFFVLSGLILLRRHFYTNNFMYLAGSGVCFGLAITMKQHAALISVFALFYLLRRCRRQTCRVFQPIITSFCIFVFFVLLPLLLIAMAAELAGAFPELWFWTVESSLGYVNGLPLRDGINNLVDMFIATIRLQLPFWLLAIVGIAFLATKKNISKERIFILCFLVFSFAAICPGFYFREHYFVLILPAIALICGGAFVGLNNLMRGSGVNCRTSAHILCFLILISASYGIYNERDYLIYLSPLQISRKIYGVDPFQESLKIAEFIKNDTTSNDRIAIMGSEPQIFFYADRISASGHVYMYNMMDGTGQASRNQEQFIREVELTRPKYIVLVNIKTSWLAGDYSDKYIFNWINKYLGENYTCSGGLNIYNESTKYYLHDHNFIQNNENKGRNIVIFKRMQS